MGKGTEDDGNFRTVECLRGRLIAERVASKAANEEADLMAKRLDVLEKNLAEEIRSRNRAHKKLKHALKRLKSLDLLNFSESLGSLDRSKTDSETMDSSEQSESKGEMKEMEREEDDGFDSFSSGSANHNVSQEGSSSLVGTAHSWNKEAPTRDEDSNEGDSEESIVGAVRKASCNNAKEQKRSVHETEQSDDTLALVPEKSTPAASKTNIDNVQNVLLALRHVKEQLRNSMERRTAAAVPYPQTLYGH